MDSITIRQPRIVREQIGAHVDFCLSCALIIIGVLLILLGIFSEDRGLKSFALAYVALPI